MTPAPVLVLLAVWWAPASGLLSAARQRGPRPKKTVKTCDVVVVGGGISGLATALELRRRGKSVVVVSRDLAESATRAAGGMLAPQAERLESGDLLDLCLEAREAWPAWLDSLEDPPELQSLGGFVSPSLDASDPISRWSPPPEGGPAEWLDARALRALEPALTADIEGGWWYPLEKWVDPVKAHESLLATCEAEGVEVMVGVEVAGVDLGFAPKKKNRHAKGGSSSSSSFEERAGPVRLGDGTCVDGADIVVAAGAWLRDLLPVPVEAQKGQMIALKPPPGAASSSAASGPRRVVFGSGTYLIPRGDRLVVGATVENGTMSTHSDVRGVRRLLDSAVRLCPALDDWTIDDQWAGLRPTTIDGAPVLGKTRWPNLWVAGGYWRNGVLLAPKAAQLLADAIDDGLTVEDARLLEACRWDRFFVAKTTDSSKLKISNYQRKPRPRVMGGGSPPVVRQAVAAAGGATASQAALEDIKGTDADAMARNRALLFGGVAQKAPPPQPMESVADRDEGGYEAILAKGGDAMADALAANRALLFGGGGPAAPHRQTTVPSEPEGAAPPGKTSLDSFRLWRVNGDGSTGEEVDRANLPTELRFATTRADMISSLQPMGGSRASAADDGDDADPSKKNPLDRLYAKINSNKRQHTTKADRDEGGYEAILAKGGDAMADALAANRALLFGGGPAAPHRQTTVPSEPEGAAPPGKTSLDSFRLWRVNGDGSTGEEVDRANLPTELRFATTRADMISSLQPMGGSKASAAAAAAADDEDPSKNPLDRLYAKINRNKRQHTTKAA